MSGISVIPRIPLLRHDHDLTPCAHWHSLDNGMWCLGDTHTTLLSFQYLEELPCPARRQYSTVYLQMINEVGQHFEDRVAMSFNMRFYRALKWVLVAPFMAMAGTIVFIKDMQAVLPF